MAMALKSDNVLILVVVTYRRLRVVVSRYIWYSSIEHSEGHLLARV